MHQIEWQSPRNQEERQRTLYALARAGHDARRLAARRRVLGALLVTTGAPLIVLGCLRVSPLGWTEVGLASLWLATALPMIRVLALESTMARRAASLRAAVLLDDED